MPASDADLADLIRQTASGDRRAFAALYRATSAKLYGIALRICRDAATAQDVLQEAYLKVWNGAARYDRSAGRPVAWLVAVARNAAIDVIRRRTDIALGMDEDGRSLIEDLAGPADGLAADEAASLKSCLENLDESHRRCLVLAYCEGWSREELAARYDRPVGTIKTWLHRGLANLRDCLDGK